MLPAEPQTALAVGAPADPSAAPPNPMVTIPMTEEERIKWKGDITRANKRREIFEPSWERNLKNYAPDPTDTAWGSEINPGVDFWQTEQKKDQLFFDTPEVIFTPEPDSDDKLLAQIAKAQAALNRKLGRKGLDAKRLMDQISFDILCPSGMGCSKLGVTRITKDVPIDPNNPEAGTVPMPVYQKIFWERFSPKKALIPDNFRSTEFDKSPWLGDKFAMPTRAGIREFKLPPDFKGKSKGASEQVLALPGVPSDDTDDDQITGVEIFYKASLYDDNVYHPEHLRQLVFVDGVDEPVVHRDSPYQTFKGGVYQPDDPANMPGNPIHIMTIRDMSDSAYIPSDCTVTRPIVTELARYRQQGIDHRDSSNSIRIGNEAVFGGEAIVKTIKGPHGLIILVPEAQFDPNRPPLVELAHPQVSRENFQFQDILERDLQKVTAQSANQTGAQQDHQASATETTYVQRSADVRLAAERNRFAAGFLAGVAKLDALDKRFETPPGQAPLAGYTYDIKPDSGMHVDAATDRKYALEVYNQLRKDSRVNPEYLLTELAPMLRLDASKLIAPPPPPAKPDPPKTSIIIRGEDISPLQPQYANVLEVLKEEGVTLTATPITPELTQNAALSQPMKQPAPHSGTPAEADVVSKHSADEMGTHATPHFGGKASVQ